MNRMKKHAVWYGNLNPEQDSQDLQDEQDKRLPFTYVSSSSWKSWKSCKSCSSLEHPAHILNILLMRCLHPQPWWGFENGEFDNNPFVQGEVYWLDVEGKTFDKMGNSVKLKGNILGLTQPEKSLTKMGNSVKLCASTGKSVRRCRYPRVSRRLYFTRVRWLDKKRRCC